jgi:Tfp pilus assembly protein PilN
LFTKFIWSEKLEEISRVIPFGVWLTSISLEKRRASDTENSFESRTFKFLGLMGQSKGQYLVFLIKGNAVAPTIPQEIDLIGKFNEALKKSELFFKDFYDVELKNVAKSSIANTDVMSFEFVCPFK